MFLPSIRGSWLAWSLDDHRRLLQVVMVHICPLLGSFLSGFMVASGKLWLGATGRASISFGGFQASEGWGDGGGICCRRHMVVHGFLGFTMGQLSLLLNSISSAHFLSVCFLHYGCFWSIYCRVAGWQGLWCVGHQANLGHMSWENCSWVALWSCPCISFCLSYIMLVIPSW